MKRIVVITGASRGLGLSLAQKFVSSGDTVYGVSATKKHWKNIPDSLIDSGRFQIHQLNLVKEAAVKAYLKRIAKKARRIDLVINNAGYGGKLEPVHQLRLQEFQKSLNLNLISAFLVCKYALPILKRQGKGEIFNVSSMAGTRAVPRLFAYSAAKFGVLALTQAIAKENSEWDFRAITVCPGGMNTQMRASLFGKEDASRQQTTDFVADLILQIAERTIQVENGGHIVIRHGQITGIFGQPGA